MAYGLEGLPRMPTTTRILEKRIVFGMGLLLLIISISSFLTAVLKISNWRFAGFETELHAILVDIAMMSLIGGLFCILAAIFLKRDPPKRVIHGVIINISLILGGVVFAFILIEAFLHQKYRDVQIGGIFTPSRYTFYKKYYQVNEQGYRDLHHSLRKPEGTFRILAVGDSFTFGSGVKRVENLYFKILEKKLQREYPQETFEVVSLAKKGVEHRPRVPGI